jgi:NADH-quinone oxidoreductase subunit C
MTPDLIAEKLQAKFGDKILEFAKGAINPFVKVVPEAVHEVCKFLKEEPDLYFDLCHSVSGYDLGAGKNLGVIYHFFSIRHNHWFTVKTEVPREGGHIPTVAFLWRTADWHEREVYDLFGITFDGHPDHRRILCPDDWEGWPLRKDYVVQEYYHGIRVPYKEDWEKFETLAANPDRGHYVFQFERRLPVSGDGKPLEEKN